MQTALARKPEEGKSHAAPEPGEVPELSPETVAGARVGMPLFLRRLSGGPPPVQRQEATKDLGEDDELRDEEESAVQAKLEVNEPGDVWEQEADGVASAVMRKEELAASTSHGTPPGVQRKCAACASSGQTCSECAEEEEEPDVVQRKAASAGPSPSGSSIPIPDSGAPLSGAVRERIEPVLGTDLSSVRVHSSPAARESARSLRARAFTHRDHIWVGPGQSADDVELMAHEAAHVVQQTAGPGGPKPVQRAPDTPAASIPADPQRASGPCAILVEGLSNEGLLFQLNRARLYLTQHQRGEGEWYDYANLLRRLSGERRRRIQAGHVWLAEPGLLHVPPLLYAMSSRGALQISVERVEGAMVAGLPTAAGRTLMTPQQFDRFLAQRNIPAVDPAEYFARQDPTRPNPLLLDLPPELRTVYRDPILSVDPGPSDLLAPWRFAPRVLPGAPGIGGGPLGSGGPDAPGILPPVIDPLRASTPGVGSQVLHPLFPGSSSYTYVVSAGQALRELNQSPGSVASSGPERVYLPAGAPAAAPLLPVASGLVTAVPSAEANPFLFPDGSGHASPVSGMSSLGFLGQPDVPLPANSTGILWEGSHTSDFVVMNGRIFPRGFRASMLTHGRSDIERMLMAGGGPTTARLNVGTPGTYANDALFPFFPGAVAVYRRDGTPLQAEELMRLMATAGPAMEGQEYRYSAPSADSPTGRSALRRAGALAARRGIPNWCPAGAQSCINLPMAVHDVALGGRHMVLPAEGGAPPIDLADPHAATARNMDRFVELPDAFFEERGLVRVRLGPRMLGGVGMSGVLGAGTSLVGDALLSPEGTSPHYVRDASLGFASSAAGHVAENYFTNFAANRFAGAGVAPGSPATLGRFAGSTGVAFVLAPAMTVVGMAFDDEQYTRIDYAARAGRSTVAAGGGALATGAFFALMGSEVPIAGNIAGFLIGIGAYYLTDQTLGEATEESIRESLGEGGCTNGVGPGR